MKESFTLKLRRPRQLVFDAITDIDALARMSNGAVTVEPVAGRSRGGPGSACLLKTNQAAIGDVLCETREWSPPESCTRHFALKDMPITLAFRLEEDGDGGATLLHIDLELEPQSFVAKMMAPMLAAQIRDGKQKALEHIQRELDEKA